MDWGRRGHAEVHTCVLHGGDIQGVVLQGLAAVVVVLAFSTVEGLDNVPHQVLRKSTSHLLRVFSLCIQSNLDDVSLIAAVFYLSDKALMTGVCLHKCVAMHGAEVHRSVRLLRLLKPSIARSRFLVSLFTFGNRGAYPRPSLCVQQQGRTVGIY